MSQSMSKTAASPASSRANGEKRVVLPAPDAPVTTIRGSVAAGSRLPHSGQMAEACVGSIGVRSGHDWQ